ncbi:MAG: glycosyl hydrolase [Phenylobacterium sp.]|uniref:WD40/YVTN/BNR-like repeat-containing protein n=1 Tax=Phenylobacterium sp. TaxID=1871053 RepID=UPI001208CE4E|nr:glycosyl hydrolase [Phenylobacterium sp.]TAJ71119.1 MAG: glycosyl hydrolase [Phenylobacterium sp.]
MAQAIQLLVGTRKGAWIYRSDQHRQAWSVEGPMFLGQIVNHFVRDPRDGRTMLMAASTGHLGPTILRSVDGGATWAEAKRPPAFPKGDPHGRSVDHSFWLEPGHADEPGVWWAGSSPPGLFRSADGGETWDGVEGLNQHPQVMAWFPPEGGTPDGAILNQILIDPRDARHMYLATCSAGVLETRDQGATWRPLNQNVRCDFLPDPYPEFGQDSHYVALAPSDPDRLWQQNHCGIYRLDRPGERWERIGEAMPKDVGDIGFTIVPHARDRDTAWVWPMDGTEVWPRTSPGGRPAAYRTRDAGASWERQDRGFPAEQGWFTVKRQAFCADRADPLGLYIGTTGGEIWMSGDEGASWRQIAAHLPEIYSVAAVEAA